MCRDLPFPPTGGKGGRCNHLGNVLVTISDKKLGYSSNDSTVDYFNPQVVSAQDYYPFGMLQPGREFNTMKYRYGFQGQEKDDDIKGEGNSIVFEYRILDPRLGRFLSIDPLALDFPFNSPYVFAENRVIDGFELEGAEVVLVNNDEHNKLIYNAGMKNKDQSAVHIYAHGTPGNLDMSSLKKGWSHNPLDFQAVLELSDVYKNAKNTNKVVVILHSCRTGRSYFDESGNYVPSFAEQMSKAFPNLTIIAPDERDLFSTKGELGPRQLSIAAINKRGDPDPSDKDRNTGDVEGNWNVFEGGKWTGQYNSSYSAASVPSWWNNEFNYKPIHLVFSGTVTASKLNVRSGAGINNSIIGKLSRDMNVSLTGKVNGDWSEVLLPGGSTGWVISSKLNIKITQPTSDAKKE